MADRSDTNSPRHRAGNTSKKEREKRRRTYLDLAPEVFSRSLFRIAPLQPLADVLRDQLVSTNTLRGEDTKPLSLYVVKREESNDRGRAAQVAVSQNPSLRGQRPLALTLTPAIHKERRHPGLFLVHKCFICQFFRYGLFLCFERIYNMIVSAEPPCQAHLHRRPVHPKTHPRSRVNLRKVKAESPCVPRRLLSASLRHLRRRI